MKTRFFILLSLIFCFNTFISQANSKLFYTKERVSSVKSRIQKDSLLNKSWGDIKSVADAQLKRNSIDKLDYLSLAYLFTDDEAYSEKIIQLLEDVVKVETWGSYEMLNRKPAWRSDLNTGKKSLMTAIGYNAVYDKLTASQKKKISQALYRLGVEPLLGDWLMEPTRIHSLNSMGHNWWTSCVCMGGILALSISNEVPEARRCADAVYEHLPEWFDFSGDVLQHKPKSFDKAGGMYESLGYANFGIQEALLFYLAWGNMKNDVKLPEITQLDNLCDFFLHVCYPRTDILYNLNFGDSHKYISAESSMMLLYALGVKDEKILWYINQVEQGQHRDGYFLNRPMGFLYTPDLKKAPVVPELGKSQIFSDFGWATMRTSWEKNSTMLAVKSGHTWNHSHADANSFILYHKGFDIIKDAGNCWYPNPQYRNYFFQSEAHNVVMFNGKGQSREQQYNGSSLRGYLYNLMDAGNIKYILADGTGPLSDNFSRNFRHFLWLDNVIYIIDDLKTHEYGEFEWIWHPGGKSVKKGADITVTNKEASVVIRPLFPRMMALSDFVHDYPEDLYWEVKEGSTEDLKAKEQYYSLYLPGKFNRIKGVTAIILKDSVSQKELPIIERRDGKNWIGLRISYKGKVTDLYINQLADGRLMHSNSWIEVDGWKTDAYMFAVSYDEGKKNDNPKELFVCYGSALRKDSKSYYSSLAKLNMILKNDPGNVKIWMNGQTKMNAYIGLWKNNPGNIKVNGENYKSKFKNNLLNIRLEKK